jgi:amino acid transporter
MSEPPELKRGLSLGLLTFYGVGNILGAGIYVLIGKVAGYAGMYAPLSFLVAAVVATFTAFTYAELSARFPLSAGEAVYVRHGLNSRLLAIGVGLLIVLMGAVSAAAMSRGFVGYLHVLLDLPDALAITLLVLALGGLAAWGILESVGVAALLTVVEVFGLALVLVVAGYSLHSLPENLPALLPSADAAAWQGIFIGAFLAFYAFIGFEDMVNVAEEVKDPARNLPLAILLALLVTTLLYAAVSLIAVLSVSPERLAASEAPLAEVYQQATGRRPVVLSVISILAVVNGALIQIIMGSRILYGMSRQGWLPKVLGRVYGKTRTPLIATAVTTGVIWVLALWLPLVTLAQATSFLVLGVFCLVNISLWRIKRRDPHPQGLRVFPRWVPLFGLCASLGLILFQLLGG